VPPMGHKNVYLPGVSKKISSTAGNGEELSPRISFELCRKASHDTFG
jgi:hypothetical protein